MQFKYLICITGSFTAGKSSLAKMFADGAFENKVHFIPHTTYRPSRQDDNPMFINVIPQEIYENSIFFTKDDNYGTLQNHIDEFLTSDSQIGLSIVSCYEIPEIRARIRNDPRYSGLRLLNILLRLENSLENEVETLKRRLPGFYTSAVATKRIEWNIMFCKECFYNRAYLDANIDAVFSQSTGSLADWCLELPHYLPVLSVACKAKVSKLAAFIATNEENRVFEKRGRY